MQQPYLDVAVEWTLISFYELAPLDNIRRAPQLCVVGLAAARPALPIDRPCNERCTVLEGFASNAEMPEIASAQALLTGPHRLVRGEC